MSADDAGRTVTVTMTREQARALLARAVMGRAGSDPSSDPDFVDFVMRLAAIRKALKDGQ